MTETRSPAPLATFGEFLHHLRWRARLIQRELGAAVGYSEAHIARLESNQRMPNPEVVRAQFVEVLHLQDDPEAASQLIRLAEAAREMRHSLRADLLRSGPPTNLRSQLTSFVGRAGEIAEVKKRLGETRLLTLTGPGGVGKTRLAVQAASEVLSAFPAGMWAVPLASTQDGPQAPGAMALAIGMPSEGAVTVGALRDDRLTLIFLDTCEQPDRRMRHADSKVCANVPERERAGHQPRAVERAWRDDVASAPDALRESHATLHRARHGCPPQIRARQSR